MSWKPNLKTHRGAQKRRKSAQIRVKTRLNDAIFQRNINSINQLQRNAQYHPPFAPCALRWPSPFPRPIANDLL